MMGLPPWNGQRPILHGVLIWFRGALIPPLFYKTYIVNKSSTRCKSTTSGYILLLYERSIDKNKTILYGQIVAQ